MTTYILRRVLWLIPVLFVISVITFLLMHAAPGTPFQPRSDRPLPPAILERLERQFGLDKPIHEQYLSWVANFVQGDLGPSYANRGRDVSEIVGDNMWNSVQLGGMAFLFSVVLGIPLGVIAALRQNKWPDYFSTFFSVIGIATPSFVLAVLLVFAFSLTLDWFPTRGWSGPEYWVLPVVALGSYGVAQLARYTRASMLEVTRRDYVRTAQSKGLKERTIVVVHMLRNAFIPIVTILGPLLAGLITGSFVVESIYGIPGIGRFFIDAIGRRDYGLIMAVTMLYATLIAVMNLVVDVAYAWIDPRIRYS
ncbi:MAG TPA: ABC transporter permease [Candidatus Dormibacteraeota bacterium]|nr:ABC transporter permease [Candidatus Dormibacteraeota bacterium]